MNRRRLLPVVCLLAALCLAPQATAAPKLLVGAAWDGPKDLNPVLSKSRMDLAKLAGLDALRVTSIWTRGKTEPSKAELTALTNASTAARLDGVTLYLSVFWFSRNTPLTAKDRADFASYAASLAEQLPSVRHMIIGNENNLNLFWMPQFDARGRDAAASGYEATLAKAYDAVKQVSPTIELIGGAVSPRGEDNPHSLRHTHSPTKFILDMGNAYRASKRATPIMDTFAFHPYLEHSWQSPTRVHKSPRIVALADYPRLVGLLNKAFRGTPQASGYNLPIIYDEFGVQSRIPSKKAGSYSNKNSKAAADAVSEAVQAKYYRQALQLAYCQKTVRSFMLFGLADEPDLARWQSGLFYADGTPKSSLAVVKKAAKAARAGKLRCVARKGTPAKSKPSAKKNSKRQKSKHKPQKKHTARPEPRRFIGPNE